MPTISKKTLKLVCQIMYAPLASGWKVVRPLFWAAPLMSESLSLKSLSPLPLSFTLSWSVLLVPLWIQSLLNNTPSDYWYSIAEQNTIFTGTWLICQRITYGSWPVVKKILNPDKNQKVICLHIKHVYSFLTRMMCICQQ